MTRVVCPDCGFHFENPFPALGDSPLEVIVAEDDRIRRLQYQAALDGADYRHSVSIAANFPVGYGGGDGH